jgi:hypothetical protein
MTICRNSAAQELQKAFTTSELVALRFEFNRFDVDNSNTIDKDELRQVVKNLSGGVELTDQQLTELMDEVDDDCSGEIDWEEYLELIINLRTGRGLRSGAVSGLLSRPPLVLVVEAELGHRSFVKRLLKEVKLDSQTIPQGKIEVVDYKSAEEALEFMRELPPSRKCHFCICDTHGVLADKFCHQLQTECLVPPPVIYFSTEKHTGDPVPHLVQQHVLKEEFDLRTAERLIETFCRPDHVRDDEDELTTKSGRLKKKGMIGGRSRQGHSHSGAGRTFRKKNTINVKTRLVRAPKSFAKDRFTGSLSALSPRALAQLAVVGGAGNQESPRIFHVDPKAIEIEAAEQQRLIDEERARQQHQQHLEEDARRVEAEEVTRLPLWKMMVLPEGKRVRTCSGLHFVDSSVLEGEIEQTPRPPEKRWSPRGTRRPSPRHHRITTLNSPSSDTHY